MVVGGTEPGQQDAGEEDHVRPALGRGVKSRPTGRDRREAGAAGADEGQIRQDVGDIRDADRHPTVGERMVVGGLGDGGQQKRRQERGELDSVDDLGRAGHRAIVVPDRVSASARGRRVERTRPTG